MNSATSCYASAVCIVFGLPVMAEDLTFTHSPGATATFYGQVNLTYQGVEDGEETYNELVDNSNSTSRIGLWIDVPLQDNDLRFNFETGLGLRNTAETNQIDNPDWIDWQRTDIRKLEGVFSGQWGSVWLGQGSMATDNAAEQDNSGTSLVGYVNLADTAGAFQFRDGDDLSGILISDAFKDFDGGRRLRIRYDTPDFSGFTVSAAYGEEVLDSANDTSYYDIAVRYALGNETVEFGAALGYGLEDDDDTVEQLIASGSLTHLPTGLNLTLAAGDRRGDGGSYGYAKLGWNGDLLSQGGTAVSVDYYDGSDFVTSGSDSTAWGVQAVQSFERWNLEVYVGYRVYSYEDDTVGDYEDLSAVLVGTRWRF